MDAGEHENVVSLLHLLVNPRRACAARVTVVVLSFCLSVCLSITTFSAATSNKTANKRYEWLQCHTGFIFKITFFCKNVALESYGVKQSEKANMQISTVPWRHQKLQCRASVDSRVLSSSVASQRLTLSKMVSDHELYKDQPTNNSTAHAYTCIARV